MFLFYCLFGLFLASFNEVDSLTTATCKVSGTFIESPLYSGRRYYLRKEVTSDFNLIQAEATCMTMGGRLAEINDDAEFRFVQSFMRPYQYFAVYIAGSDEAREGSWINPLTRTPLSLIRWGWSEPNGGTTDNCLCLWNLFDYLMCDAPCTGVPGKTTILCEVPQ